MVSPTAGLLGLIEVTTGGWAGIPEVPRSLQPNKIVPTATETMNILKILFMAKSCGE
jgi:hypothetical protein